MLESTWATMFAGGLDNDIGFLTDASFFRLGGSQNWQANTSLRLEIRERTKDDTFEKRCRDGERLKYETSFL